MAYIILTVLILSVAQLILDRKIRRKVVYGGSLSQTDGFASYVWSIVILALLVLICFFFINDIHPLIGILLMALFGVRAVFEWIYIRKTQRHIVSLLMVALSLVVTIIFFVIWK